MLESFTGKQEKDVWNDYVSIFLKDKKFINELNNTEIIISGGVKFNWLAPLEERLFLVNAYIEENFEKIETIEDWTLLKRKNN